MEGLGRNLGGQISWAKVKSHHAPDMFPMIWLPWQRALPINGALNILQLWASGGRTREPILI